MYWSDGIGASGSATAPNSSLPQPASHQPPAASTALPSPSASPTSVGHYGEHQHHLHLESNHHTTPPAATPVCASPPPHISAFYRALCSISSTSSSVLNPNTAFSRRSSITKGKSPPSTACVLGASPTTTFPRRHNPVHFTRNHLSATLDRLHCEAGLTTTSRPSRRHRPSARALVALRLDSLPLACRHRPLGPLLLELCACVRCARCFHAIAGE